MDSKINYKGQFQKTKDEIEKYIQVTSLPNTSKKRIFNLIDLLDSIFLKSIEEENLNK